MTYTIRCLLTGAAFTIAFAATAQAGPSFVERCEGHELLRATLSDTPTGIVGLAAHASGTHCTEYLAGPEPTAADAVLDVSQANMAALGAFNALVSLVASQALDLPVELPTDEDGIDVLTLSGVNGVLAGGITEWPAAPKPTIGNEPLPQLVKIGLMAVAPTAVFVLVGFGGLMVLRPRNRR